MDNIVVTRVGIIGAAPHRYLDLLLHPKVKSVRYFYFDNEEKNYQALLETYSLHKTDSTANFSGRKFRWYSFFTKYIQLVKKLDMLLSLIPNEMLRIIAQEFTKADILMIGDNDYDCSIGLAAVCAILGIPYVLTFKETRFRKDDVLEKWALEGATKIVVPHRGYVDFIKKKHGIDISKRVIFADVDWRSKFIFDKYIRNKQVQKLSERDGRLHVCILASRTIWDPKETRSKGRYYYVDIIEKLLKSGFVVHLHTNAIIKSLDEPIFVRDNPYTHLEKRFPGKFLIEKPIDLKRPEGYYELMRYDLGLLTSGKVEDEIFMEFEKYNIPNRYYEYKHAGVVPIAPKGVLKYMEENCEDVIFFEEPTEIYEKIHEVEYLRIQFYRNLVDKVISELFLEPCCEDEYILNLKKDRKGFNIKFSDKKK